MTKNVSKIFALALTGVCASTAANAAGWQLNDFSVTGLGRAYAGGGIVGDDYSALAYNPAGMTLGGTGIQASAMGIYLHSDVTGNYKGKTDAGNVDVIVPVPNVFGQYKVNDRVTVGLGVYVPFGLAIKYDRDWIATDHGLDSELQVVDIAPTIAVKATDKLSLGLGFIARHASVQLTSTAAGKTNRFDIEDWGYGFRLGGMYEFTKDTRAGLSVQTRSQHQIKGTFTLMDMQDFDARLPMDAPEKVSLSFFHKLNDKVGLSAGLNWTHWTRFKALDIRTSSPIQVEVAQRWKNAWNGSVGMDYYLNEKVTLRTGIGFDESPIPNSFERTSAIADNDRWQFSVGASYKKQAWTFDAGYMFLYLPHYNVNNDRHDLAGNPGAAPLKAKYQTTAHVLGLQVQYSFDAIP